MNERSLIQRVSEAMDEFRRWREQNASRGVNEFIAERAVEQDVAAQLRQFARSESLTNSAAATTAKHHEPDGSLDRTADAGLETDAPRASAEDRLDRVRSLFLQAIEKPDEQRDAWLAERCGDDAQLRDIVQSLLQHDHSGPDRLAEGVQALLQDSDAPDTAGDSSLANERFDIVRFHQRGGLGEVYVAHDRELNRHVALKQVRRDFVHDHSARSRFLLEAEITGKLEHPGIVPVYGCGVGLDQRPYYAMRFIRGDSSTGRHSAPT